jgi:hypothetical protein
MSNNFFEMEKSSSKTSWHNHSYAYRGCYRLVLGDGDRSGDQG